MSDILMTELVGALQDAGTALERARDLIILQDSPKVRDHYEPQILAYSIGIGMIRSMIMAQSLVRSESFRQMVIDIEREIADGTSELG